MFKFKTKKGFTLIELLVVIAIIGFLASVAMYALNNTRVAARDTQRLADVKAITKALEMYYNEENNHIYPYADFSPYPAISCVVSGNPTPLNRWNIIKSKLKNYIDLPNDPLNVYPYCYTYDSNAQDNYQTYALAAALESSSNNGLELNDNGSSDTWYEIGNQIDYCKQKYGDSNSWYAWSSVCLGGN